jgi:hypothetical protein
MPSDYDYLSILIQGGDTCGASCFDPNSNPPRLLFSTNKTEKRNHDATLINSTQEYLALVARHAHTIQEDAPTPQEINEMRRQIEEQQGALIRLASERFNAATQANTNLTPQQREHNQSSHNERYEKSIDAVTNSIFEGTFDTQERVAGHFSAGAIAAMRRGDSTIVRQEGVGGGDLHAELKILQLLANRDGPRQDDRQSYVIGTSKLLCSPCDTVFESVAEQHTRYEFSHPASHGKCFASAYPDFIVQNPEIGRAVLRKMLEGDKFTGAMKDRVRHTLGSTPLESASGTVLRGALNCAFHPGAADLTSQRLQSQEHDMRQVNIHPFAALNRHLTRSHEQQVQQAPAAEIAANMRRGLETQQSSLGRDVPQGQQGMTGVGGAGRGRGRGRGSNV